MEPEDTGEPLREQVVFKLFRGLRTKGMLSIMVAYFFSLPFYRTENKQYECMWHFKGKYKRPSY